MVISKAIQGWEQRSLSIKIWSLRSKGHINRQADENTWGEWPSGLNSSRQVTEVKLGRVRSNSGWVTLEA